MLEFFIWISTRSRPEAGCYDAIKMTTQFVFAQVSLLIILITAITSMWLTVGVSLTRILFWGMLIMMRVVSFGDKQSEKISEENDKTGQLWCAKMKSLDTEWYKNQRSQQTRRETRKTPAGETESGRTATHALCVIQPRSGYRHGSCSVVRCNSQHLKLGSVSNN